MHRRDALLLFGSTIAWVAGCSDDDTPGTPAGGAGSAPVGDAAIGDGASAASTWARGGTASLPRAYADPFTDPLGSACSITCKTTVGPCYATTLERRDISEGYPGLPVRVAFLIVDETCKPLPGVTVDVWHTRNTGLYSGTDNGTDFPPLPPEGVPFLGGPVVTTEQLIGACTKGDADASSHHYFRGVQTTDARGRVEFETCFPGWYEGRAVHFHYILRLAGEKYVTSQLYFPDTLTLDIFNTHPDYVDYGPNNTTNATDSYYQGVEQEFSIQRQPDGTLLAYKTLVVRSSLTEDLCGFEDPRPRTDM